MPSLRKKVRELCEAAKNRAAKKKEKALEKDIFFAYIRNHKYLVFAKDADGANVVTQGVNDIGELNDGYHSFNELYRYRMLYNAAFFNMLATKRGAARCDVHKSKKHSDGEDCFGGGWFIVIAELPTGQISNHYELKDWDLFKVPEKEVANVWDGHTPKEAAERLEKYLLSE